MEGMEGMEGAPSGAAVAAVAGVVMLVMFAICVALYLFTCYCMKKVCLKKGIDPGIGIWIPILQLFPIFKVAEVEGIMILVALIFAPYLCYKLVIALGKPPIMTLLMFLGPVFPAYLAFSSGPEPAAAAAAPTAEPPADA